MDLTHQHASLPSRPVAGAAGLAPALGQVAALIVFGTLGILVLTLMPSLLGALADNAGASPEQIGLIASLELGGTALGGACVLVGGHRFSVRQFLGCGLLLMLAGASASALAEGLIMTGAAWACLGFGGGLVAGATMRSAASLAYPDRMYALIVIGQMSTGFFAFLILPQLLGQLGLQGAFASLGAICLLLAPLIRLVPAAEGGGGATSPFALLGRPAVLISSSILLHYTANSMLWSYVDRIAVSYDVPKSTIDWALAGSMISGLVGALTISIWIRRFSLPSAIFLGICLIMVAAALLLGGFSSTFVIGVMMFNLANMFVFPAYLGYLASLSAGEDAVTLGNLGSFVGLMCGPALGSMLIIGDGYGVMVWGGIALFAIALMMAILGIRSAPGAGALALDGDGGP